MEYGNWAECLLLLIRCGVDAVLDGREVLSGYVEVVVRLVLLNAGGTGPVILRLSRTRTPFAAFLTLPERDTGREADWYIPGKPSTLSPKLGSLSYEVCADIAVGEMVNGFASPVSEVNSFLAPCFFKCDWELDRCVAPVGFPRLIEHFWKCRLRMSLRENVSLHKIHEYGRSPVSMAS